MSEEKHSHHSTNSLTDVRDGGGGVDEHASPTGLMGRYYHPVVQVVMLGFVCFMVPGLFNALNGLGGGGQVNPSTSANANAAVYATFAGMAFFAG